MVPAAIADFVQNSGGGDNDEGNTPSYPFVSSRNPVHGISDYNGYPIAGGIRPDPNWNNDGYKMSCSLADDKYRIVRLDPPLPFVKRLIP